MLNNVIPICPAKICLLPSKRLSGWIRFIYRLEPVIAAVTLFALSPLILALGIVIVMLSRRSPLVSHARVGWHGTPLGMLKLRTMWNDDSPPSVSVSVFIEDVSGRVPAVKNARDPRVTSRFAAFCRRFSLDELPQLYHVARGEMSLVGPRPVTRAELETYYGDCAGEVVSLRPGLTGLWQIAGRSRLTYEDRKQLDLVLVRDASPALYLGILLRSIPKVITGSGAC